MAADAAGEAESQQDRMRQKKSGEGLAAFASANFRRYQSARLAVIMGAEAQAVAVAWQVYAMTHKALDLGLTGLALFLPGLLFLLPSGHVADRFDRRNIILVCYSLQMLCTGSLLAIALSGVRHVELVYVVLVLIGTGRAFSGPASSALVPHLVPEEHFVNAVTWGAAIFQTANIIGPALGGLLFTLPGVGFERSLAGAAVVYVFTLCTQVFFLARVGRITLRLGRMEHRAASMEVILAGFRFVRHTQLLIGSLSLDLFVVLLGGAVALMPIFAEEVLHTGARGLGMLRAAPALGALCMSMVLARFPLRRRAGSKLFVGVAIFGVTTVIFGLSHNLTLSLTALAIGGAADMISVVIRSSLLQLATPPEMRGRVSAVNALFLGGSNELGEFESGVTAQWMGAVRATVVGGIGSLVVTGLWAWLFPQLRAADELSAEALRKQRMEASEN